jgi:hypothetical protein
MHAVPNPRFWQKNLPYWSNTDQESALPIEQSPKPCHPRPLRHNTLLIFDGSTLKQTHAKKSRLAFQNLPCLRTPLHVAKKMGARLGEC